MKWNFKNELARKFVHLLSISILVIYFLVSDIFDKQIALIILVLVLIVFIEFEYLRIEIPREIPILKDIWGYSKRKKEKNRLGGDVFFLIGAILVLAVFDLRIAIAAILMTTFGDMTAALIGKKFGKHWLKYLKNRAWEGILAEFFVNILIGYLIFFWGRFGLINDLKTWIVIFVMAITATIVETLIYKMDDNLLIPVFAGFNGQIALLILNYFL
jgi:dolichol kinase